MTRLPTTSALGSLDGDGVGGASTKRDLDLRACGTACARSPRGRSFQRALKSSATRCERTASRMPRSWPVWSALSTVQSSASAASFSPVQMSPPMRGLAQGGTRQDAAVDRGDGCGFDHARGRCPADGVELAQRLLDDVGDGGQPELEVVGEQRDRVVGGERAGSGSRHQPGPHGYMPRHGRGAGVEVVGQVGVDAGVAGGTATVRRAARGVRSAPASLGAAGGTAGRTRSTGAGARHDLDVDVALVSEVGERLRQVILVKEAAAELPGLPEHVPAWLTATRFLVFSSEPSPGSRVRVARTRVRWSRRGE